MKKLLVILLLGMFFVSFASALELNPFADKKSFTKKLKDIDTNLRVGFNEKYGSIRLSKTAFWLESDRVAEYVLTKNTDRCLIYCEAEGKARLYKDTTLFNDVEFLNVRDEEETIKHTIYIRKFGWYTGYIETIDKNNKTIRTPKIYLNKSWRVYNGQELEAGVYDWKIKGVKENPHERVDWIVSKDQKKFTEWAWWDSFDGVFVIKNITGVTDWWEAPAGVTNISLLVVAGGASGGNGDGYGGGGGGGIYFSNSHTVTAGYNYTIIVGDGGRDAAGGNSRFGDVLAYGGGLGGDYGEGGSTGGSGGGGGAVGQAGAAATKTNQSSNEYGNAGGTGSGSGYAGGGGGGAGATGSAGASGNGGAGGAGQQIFGEYWGGGGGGGSHDGLLAAGGSGGGGDGGQTGGAGAVDCQSGTNYTGGGGGGHRNDESCEGGTGIVVIRYLTDTGSVSLVEPANSAVTSSPLLLNATLNPSSGYNVTNATLYVGSQTNFTAYNYDGSYSFPWVHELGDGSYSWNVTGCFTHQISLATSCVDSATQTFTIDSVSPVITVHNTDTTKLALSLPDNVTMNVTSSDNALSTCWYHTSEDSTNNTYTCNSTFNATFNTGGADKQVILYANDTAGNIGSATYTFNYTLFLEYETYASQTTEGSPVNFSMGVITDGTAVSSATLNVSGNIYSGNAIVEGANNYTISRQITAPAVVADENVTWYWNISLVNGFSYAFAERTLLIQNFNVDDCSAETSVLYNFTMVDEAAQTTINPSTQNTSAEAFLQIYDNNRNNVLVNYTKDYDATNPFAICLSSNLSGGEEFNMDLQLQYDADGYAEEFYHVQNEQLTQEDMNNSINLYDLLDTSSQEFLITYKDAQFLPVADAIIHVQRKYISEGVFKTVEIPKTGTDGTTLAHLAISDVIYTFLVYKNGVLLSTFENQIAVCDNVATGDCTINLNEVSSSSTPEAFVNVDGVSFSISYDEPTRTVSTVFAVASGNPRTLVQNVTLADNFGSTSVCTDTLITSSGTLSCVIPVSYENSTVTVTIEANGELLGRMNINLADDKGAKFGGSQVFLVMFAFLILVGVGMSGSPALTGIFMALGAIAVSAFGLLSNNGLLGIGTVTVWFVLLIILVLIKGGKRE